METEKEYWTRADLSRIFFATITDRMAIVACRGAEDLGEMHRLPASVLSWDKEHLKHICRHFFVAAGEDFEAFLETLADALISENWSGNNIEVFVKDFYHRFNWCIQKAPKDRTKIKVQTKA